MNFNYTQESHDSHQFMNELPAYRDLSGISPEHLSTNGWEEEPKYRSVGAIMPNATYFSKYDSMEVSMEHNNLLLSKPTLKKSNVEVYTPAGVCASTYFGVTEKNNNSEKQKTNNVPEKPCYLVKTHFKCHETLDTLLNKVSRVLDQLCEVSYEFMSFSYKVDTFLLV